VRNVVVIVPLRPYTAKARILPEQTIGRGLRKMWPQDPEAPEQLVIIEHPMFRDVIEKMNQEQKLGLTFTTPQEAYKGSIIIKVNEKKLEYDLEVPVLRGGLTHSVKPLEKLRASELPTKQFEYQTLKVLDPKIKKRDLLTREVEEEEILKFPYADQPEIYLASITRAVLKRARIPGQFDRVVPVVRDYIENYLFDKKVLVRDEEILRKINNSTVRYVILKNFVDVINALTTVVEKPEWSGEAIKASTIKPFPWSRKTLEAKKTILNFLPLDNDFEVEIAQFFDRADDVLAFIKNDTRTLKLKIPYTDQSGFLRYYIPDFVVKTDEEIVIVETKGREDVDVQFKDKRAEEWCKFATKLTKQRWSYLRIDQKDFQRRVWQRFDDLVRKIDAA
jgi:type III restriction enzyme